MLSFIITPIPRGSRPCACAEDTARPIGRPSQPVENLLSLSCILFEFAVFSSGILAKTGKNEETHVITELGGYNPLTGTYTPPGHLVDVGGHRLHIFAAGEGSPSVVLEAGRPGWCVDWRHVQPGVAEFTRVCAYDRAGLGWSEPGPKPRHALQMAEELRRLLERSDLHPPYVMVGAAFGAHIVRLFHHFFPEEVVGMVLVEARHPEQDTRMPEAWSRREKRAGRRYRFLSRLARWRILPYMGGVLGERIAPKDAGELPAHFGAKYLAPSYFATNLAELEALPESDRQVRATDSPWDIPLIVIRHGVPGLFSKLPADLAEQAEQTWRELQEDLTRLSGNSELWVAEGASQDIPLEEPSLVVEAIREVVEKARQRGDRPK
jgi:pimeloyl-ACP methyl ester carboxylesterase